MSDMLAPTAPEPAVPTPPGPGPRAQASSPAAEVPVIDIRGIQPNLNSMAPAESRMTSQIQASVDTADNQRLEEEQRLTLAETRLQESRDSANRAQMASQKLDQIYGTFASDPSISPEYKMRMATLYSQYRNRYAQQYSQGVTEARELEAQLPNLRAQFEERTKGEEVKRMKLDEALRKQIEDEENALRAAEKAEQDAAIERQEARIAAAKEAVTRASGDPDSIARGNARIRQLRAELMRMKGFDEQQIAEDLAFEESLRFGDEIPEAPDPRESSDKASESMTDAERLDSQADAIEDELLDIAEMIERGIEGDREITPERAEALRVRAERKRREVERLRRLAQDKRVRATQDINTPPEEDPGLGATVEAWARANAPRQTPHKPDPEAFFSPIGREPLESAPEPDDFTDSEPTPPAAKKPIDISDPEIKAALQAGYTLDQIRSVQ